ncbi:hypothetical protein CFP56_022712 [Quercus suber]|uniref:DUF4283 domain-containing protein n=1 Tax=Quercus suber TaxID=58331 RepID=A0AAW0KCR7_QUESU
MGDTQSHNNDDILTNTIFRKGLVIQLDSVSLERNKVLWRHCLVGYLLDERRFSIRRMQSILNSAWRLRGSIRIVGRQESYYIIHFEYPTDQEYILCEGPWFVDGALLVVEQWTPNLALNQIQLTFFTTWVQVHNLPLEYHDTDLAHFMAHFPRNICFLRLQVRIDPWLPLVARFILKRDDGQYMWIECRYECIFKICKKCGLIGHS